MSSPLALAVEDVIAGYGGAPVLDGISMQVKPASITAVLGANGAGKTTLLATISGFVRPRQGRVALDGTDLTRRAPDQPTAVDLNRLVRDTSELVRPVVAGAGLSLRVVPDASLPTLVGHRDQLQQVVLNLLTNAMDATSPGGSIRVTTRALAATNALTLEVRDTGRGIGEAERKQIFDPFFSTKEAGRGTGLGLFISAQIVRDHGGRIELDSVEGEGSTFRVVLPLRHEDA